MSKALMEASESSKKFFSIAFVARSEETLSKIELWSQILGE
jgi:hypothetical protein